MKFLRRIWKRHGKLGKNRKKKQNWRKPRGRDNKMREMRKGYPSVVKVGYGKSRREKNRINGKETVVVYNPKELANAENKIVIIGNVGRKKKMEIVEEIKKRNLAVLNVNMKKILNKNKVNKNEPKK